MSSRGFGQGESGRPRPSRRHAAGPRVADGGPGRRQRPAAGRGPLVPTIAILVVAVVLVLDPGAAVDRGAVVRLASASTAVFGTELTTKVAAVRRRRPAHGGASVASSLVIGYRTRPIYAPVSASSRTSTTTARRSSRCAGSRRRVPAAARPVRRLRRGRAVADVPAVAQRRRRSAPRTRSSASTSASSSSPCRGCGSSSASSRWSLVLGRSLALVHPLPLRRAAARRPAASAPRTAARVHLSILAGGARARPGGELLARPLLADHQGLAADHRHPLHRRARGAADQGDPRRSPRSCAPCCSSRRSGPARWRLPSSASACCVIVRDRRRRHLPGRSSSASRSSPSREVARGALHRAQHRGDPRGVRPRRRRDHELQRRDRRRARASCATTPRRSPASGWSTRIVVAPTFKQLQAVKSYYQFPDALDVDRYTIDGKLQRHRRSRSASSTSTACAADQRNWLNDHTVYTHGFGVVAAYGNQRGADGQPVFFEQNIPPTGRSATFEPRIYFGEQSPDYSIVGGAAGAAPRELDYPDGSAGGQQNNTYTGKGGVPHRQLRRASCLRAQVPRAELPALRRRQRPDSQLLYHRTPRERVEQVAPWLTLDGNAYPAVVDGRVQWILDGYTTTADYPYSRLHVDRRARPSDSLTATLAAASQALGSRPGQLHPQLGQGHGRRLRRHGHALRVGRPGPAAQGVDARRSPAPCSRCRAISGDLMSHLRYPEDLFKVQRDAARPLPRHRPGRVLRRPGLLDGPRTTRPRSSGRSPQPPYYLTLQMPGPGRSRRSR